MRLRHRALGKHVGGRGIIVAAPRLASYGTRQARHLVGGVSSWLIILVSDVSIFVDNGDSKPRRPRERIVKSNHLVP